VGADALQLPWNKWEGMPSLSDDNRKTITSCLETTASGIDSKQREFQVTVVGNRMEQEHKHNI